MDNDWTADEYNVVDNHRQSVWYLGLLTPAVSRETARQMLSYLLLRPAPLHHQMQSFPGTRWTD